MNNNDGTHKSKEYCLPYQLEGHLLTLSPAPHISLNNNSMTLGCFILSLAAFVSKTSNAHTYTKYSETPVLYGMPVQLHIWNT